MDKIVSDRDAVWYRDTNILFAGKRVLEFWPHPMHTPAEKVNALVRFCIYAGIILYLMTRKPKYPILGAVATLLISLYYNKYEKEAKAISVAMDATSNVRASTVENPFGNPLTVGEEPTGEEIDMATQDINLNARVPRDFEDAWEKQSNNRQFMTMPDKDPSVFANYLYGDPPCNRRCPA